MLTFIAMMLTPLSQEHFCFLSLVNAADVFGVLQLDDKNATNLLNGNRLIDLWRRFAALYHITLIQ